MLRRRNKVEVVAEVPAAESSSSRAGALGRTQLRAYADLAARLTESGSIFLSGSARSTASVGLAAAATAEGRHVALLECDLADPALAAILGLAAEPGLHEYLRGEAEASQILQPLVLAGPASGRAVEPLTCIVAGAAEAEPVALLDSERCDQAIERLRRAYDLLLIAGPGLDEDVDSLHALGEHAETTFLCGGRGEASKRPPLRVDGAVLVG
jgi:receptor protein-tyrosine kinase